MNNKHKAVISVLVLIIVFMGLALWYMATHPAPQLTPLIPSPTAQNAGPQTLMDVGPYHTITFRVPGATPLLQGNDAAVAAMRAFAEAQIAEFKSYTADLDAEDIAIQGLDEGRKYALQADYIEKRGVHTVSYVFEIMADTLGAHPNTTYRTFTFDVATGQRVELGNVFGGEYLSMLSQRVRADLPDLIARQTDSEADIGYITRGTEPMSDNFAHWYIEDKNIVFIFPPYQVGPYALGTVLDLIPLAELPTANPKYR